VSAAVFCCFQLLLDCCFSRYWSYFSHTERFSAVAGAAFFSCISFFVRTSIREILQQLQLLLRVKILSIDLEASSFDGITNSTSRGSGINHCENWNV
jgi:hypothetical protein